MGSMEDNKKEKTLKELMQHISASSHLKPSLEQSRIRSVWRETLGASIDRYTRRIYFSNGVLYAEIQSAPLKNELSLEVQKLKKRLNGELEGVSIERIVFL